MVGLLGMLAAGGAMGARDASNASVRAQNELEISNAREAMREEFLNRRFDRELDVARENAKAQAAQKEIDYQRSIEAKDKQYAHEMSKTGLLNQGRIDQEDRRNAGANARLDKRLAAEKANAQLKSSADKVDNKSITLSDGTSFTPNSPEYRLAVDMVKSGEYDNLKDAIRTVISKGLVSQAAGSIQGIAEGTVPTARNMSNELFGTKPNKSELEFDYDNKNKKLIPMRK